MIIARLFPLCKFRHVILAMKEANFGNKIQPTLEIKFSQLWK